MDEVHEGKNTDIEFGMKVLEVFKNDPLARQVMEGVKLREIKADNILNSKEEFHQPGEIIPEWLGRKAMKKSQNYVPNYPKSRQESDENVKKDGKSKNKYQKDGK